MFKNKDKFVQNTTPESGDLVAWSGHVGVVESFDDKTKKVTVLHSTKYTKKMEQK